MTALNSMMLVSRHSLHHTNHQCRHSSRSSLSPNLAQNGPLSVCCSVNTGTTQDCDYFQCHWLRTWLCQRTRQYKTPLVITPGSASASPVPNALTMPGSTITKRKYPAALPIVRLPFVRAAFPQWRTVGSTQHWGLKDAVLRLDVNIFKFETLSNGSELLSVHVIN